MPKSDLERLGRIHNAALDYQSISVLRPAAPTGFLRRMRLPVFLLFR